MSSSSSTLPPVVPTQHCSNVPVLYESLKGEEKQCRVWLRDEINQIADPLIDSLFIRLIMSSSSSATVPQYRSNVSELCEILEEEKMMTRMVLKGELDRLVNTLFDRLTDKLVTNTDFDRSVDGGERAQVVDTMDQVESPNTESHQPSSLISQPSTSSFNSDSQHQQHSNGNEMELSTVKMIEIKEVVQDGEQTRPNDIDSIIDNLNESEQQIRTVRKSTRNVTDKQNSENGQSAQPVIELDHHRSINIASTSSGRRSSNRKRIPRKVFGGEQSNCGVKSDKRKSKNESTSKATKRIRIRPGNDDEIQHEEDGVDGDHFEVGESNLKIVILELNCTELGCETILKSTQLWKQHLSSVHGQTRPYAKLKDNVRHNQHGQTEYPCTECEVVCKSQCSLNLHWTRSHQAGKFECSVCAFGANIVSKVRNHQWQNHSLRKFQCTHKGCNRAFVNKHDLVRHKRIHSGVRPYACIWDQCQSTFNQRQDAIRHVRVQHFRLPNTIREQNELNIIEERDPKVYVRVRG